MYENSPILTRRTIRETCESLVVVACFLFVPSLSGPAAFGQQSARVELGRLRTGADVSFVRSGTGGWGIDVAGGPAPRIVQPKPARIEVYRAGNDIQELAAGYKKVQKTASGIDADAEVACGDDVVIRVHDRWSVSWAVLSMHRNVEVKGNASGGFYSAINFTVDPSFTWPDINFMVPGAIYGDPTYDGDRSPGGTLNYAARHLLMREDILAAPLFAMSFKDGASISMLDPAPRGDTTEEESKLTNLVMTDARFQFGAMGAWQTGDGAVEFGFRFPGTVNDFGGARGEPAAPRWIRRYHPIIDGFAESYQVEFRFGQKESFRDLTRDGWRWAWNTLKPPVNYIDVDQVRRVLLDHLEAQAVTIDGRTGIPFARSTVVDTPNWNWTMIAMGFVGKNLECANQLLLEGDRDKSERGQKMRETGLGIIASMIQALHAIPLQATGYDLASGRPWDHFWLSPWLRNATEDMRVLMQAYQRELALGRPHPEWLAWVESYSDWLIKQQREDGSYPRRWKPGSNEVAEPTGTASYNAVPLLVLMTQISGDPKYQQSAIRAADYVWSTWGNRGLFIGGASDNPNITDKEAGMLSMEAFLSLYESTKDPKWLERAQAAGNFAESWIWIWNLPMAVDADNAKLHWKKGVPTVGLQDITALNTGGTDEYLDWAVPSYAKLYNYTKDPHYLEVARVLLHDTKSMVALPGRQYDMKGIGWQQENFRLGPGPNGRGVGSHRMWLPWVSANHLHGITGIEEYDPALFKKLSTKPGTVAGKTAK
jgi:hypothetical protein